MVRLGCFHFFQSSLVDKTLPCEFDGDLEYFIFLKTHIQTNAKCHNFLFQVDSVYQNIPKNSLKHTKEHLYNLERYLGKLTLI